MRLGLFGGTFDPPHIGHLLAASDVFELLELDRLVFIPAAQQPLKVERTAAPADDRLGMVRLMVEGDRRFEVDPIEIRRSGLSYTVETLAEYAARHPDAERFLCVGADTLGMFESWREPGRVVGLARLAVLTRSGGEAAEAAPAPGVAESEDLERRVRALGGAGALEPVRVATRRIEVSSTEIRARVRAGQPIRGFVTDAVARYIGDRGLYQQGKA